MTTRVKPTAGRVLVDGIGVGIVAALSLFEVLGASVRPSGSRLMPSSSKILTAAATAAILLAASVSPAAGASAAPKPKLTKTTAAAAALKDARAGATISGGDKVIVSNCRPYGRSAFKCAIQLVPESSTSRCHWTDTIALVKGRFDVQYSRIVCAG